MTQIIGRNHPEIRHPLPFKFISLRGLCTVRKYSASTRYIFLAAWNVKTLCRPGALRNVRKVAVKYSIGIAALQEMRWQGDGYFRSGNYVLIYSGGETV